MAPGPVRGCEGAEVWAPRRRVLYAANPVSRSAAEALLGEPCHRLRIMSQGSSKQRTCRACGEPIPPGSPRSPSPLVVVHRRSADGDTYSEHAVCPLCAAGIEFQGRAISFERSDDWSLKGWRTELEAERRVVQEANLAVWRAQAAEMDRRRVERVQLVDAGREATIQDPCCRMVRDAHQVERVAVWLIDFAKQITGDDMGPEHAVDELLRWARQVFAEHGAEGCPR